MIIKMHLLSDVIFGNGMSVPGAEDISVLHDEYGFPFYKGGTFKGVFREELFRYLELIGKGEQEVKTIVQNLLGLSGDDADGDKLIFSDFCVADNVKLSCYKEIGENPDMILDAFTNLRSFTSLEEDGVAKKGSLRMARCVNKGINFYSKIVCSAENEEIVKNVLGMIKWIGTMRNRGFGRIELSVVKEGK